MFARRIHRQLTAWIAAMALLLGGLLPVLSHAVVTAPANGQGWVEVCTVSGMAWVKQVADATDTGRGAQQAHTLPGVPIAPDGCDWCSTHNPLAGVPLLAGSPTAPQVFGPEVPTRFLQAPRPLFVWAAAHSRAPPFSV